MKKARPTTKPEIRVVKLGTLKLDPRNANRHTERGKPLLEDSLRQRGFARPVFAAKDLTILGGNLTTETAAAVGMDEAILIETDGSRPIVHVRKDLDPNSIDARRLALEDNRIAELSLEWDPSIIAEFAADDRSALEGLFNDKELGELLSTLSVETTLEEDADVEELLDKAGELQAKWKVNADDIWVIESKTAPGKVHRIMCGDSTNADQVDRLMGADHAALMSTDPPYMVNYDGTAKPKGNGKDWSKLYREKEIKDKRQFLLDTFATWLPFIQPNAAWFVWYASRAHSMFESALSEIGVLIHEQIVWVKPAPVAGFVKYAYQHEPCMFGWRKGNAPRFPRDWFRTQGDGKTSVWHVDFEGKKRSVGKAHPTQKPLELFARPIRNHTLLGEVCAEPFSGSGSQLIAAEMTGRVVRAMELEPAFVAVALERASLLGLEPQRLGAPKQSNVQSAKVHTRKKEKAA
jgi:DNA modification methylase